MSAHAGLQLSIPPRDTKDETVDAAAKEVVDRWRSEPPGCGEIEVLFEAKHGPVGSDHLERRLRAKGKTVDAGKTVDSSDARVELVWYDTTKGVTRLLVSRVYRT